MHTFKTNHIWKAFHCSKAAIKVNSQPAQNFLRYQPVSFNPARSILCRDTRNLLVNIASASSSALPFLMNGVLRNELRHQSSVPVESRGVWIVSESIWFVRHFSSINLSSHMYPCLSCLSAHTCIQTHLLSIMVKNFNSAFKSCTGNLKWMEAFFFF